MRIWKDPSRPYDEICEKLLGVRDLVDSMGRECDPSSSLTIALLLNTLHQMEEIEQRIDMILGHDTMWDCITCGRSFSHRGQHASLFAPCCPLTSGSMGETRGSS